MKSKEDLMRLLDLGDIGALPDIVKIAERSSDFDTIFEISDRLPSLFIDLKLKRKALKKQKEFLENDLEDIMIRAFRDKLSIPILPCSDCLFDKGEHVHVNLPCEVGRYHTLPILHKFEDILENNRLKIHTVIFFSNISKQHPSKKAVLVWIMQRDGQMRPIVSDIYNFLS